MQSSHDQSRSDDFAQRHWVGSVLPTLRPKEATGLSPMSLDRSIFFFGDSEGGSDYLLNNNLIYHRWFTEIEWDERREKITK